MEIKKRILVALSNESGDIGVSEYDGEALSTYIEGTLEAAVERLRNNIKEDMECDPDDYTFVEYVAVREYVSEPKWVDIR